jgi:hypothetical protein
MALRLFVSEPSINFRVTAESSVSNCQGEAGWIPPEQRSYGQEQSSVEAAVCCQGDPIWNRGLDLSLVQDHAGLAQPTNLI